MQLENSKRIYYRDNTEEKRVIEGPESDAERLAKYYPGSNHVMAKEERMFRIKL